MLPGTLCLPRRSACWPAPALHEFTPALLSSAVQTAPLVPFSAPKGHPQAQTRKDNAIANGDGVALAEASAIQSRCLAKARGTQNDSTQRSTRTCFSEIRATLFAVFLIFVAPADQRASVADFEHVDQRTSAARRTV